jgi:hypothetical protein
MKELYLNLNEWDSIKPDAAKTLADNLTSLHIYELIYPKGERLCHNECQVMQSLLEWLTLLHILSMSMSMMN